MRPERGFALVAALFVMVVIGLAVAAMSRLSVTQTASVDLLLQQARAYQAARAGLEWGIVQTLAGQPCGDIALGQASVSVTCTPSSPFDLPEEGRSDVVFYELVATAEVGTPGSLEHAWRRLSVTMEREM